MKWSSPSHYPEFLKEVECILACVFQEPPPANIAASDSPVTESNVSSGYTEVRV